MLEVLLMFTSVQFCVKKLYIGCNTERQMASDALNGCYSTSLNAILCDLQSIFSHNFYIQILYSNYGHKNTCLFRQQYFCFPVLLGIFRSSIISIICLHKVFGQEQLLSTSSIANIHERHRDNTYIPECISTRFPQVNLVST